MWLLKFRKVAPGTLEGLGCTLRAPRHATWWQSGEGVRVGRMGRAWRIATGDGLEGGDEGSPATRALARVDTRMQVGVAGRAGCRRAEMVP